MIFTVKSQLISYIFLPKNRRNSHYQIRQRKVRTISMSIKLLDNGRKDFREIG